MSAIGDSLREGAQAILEKASDLQARIRKRAYEIWEREGRQFGQDQDHWHEAEWDVAREDVTAPKAATRKSTRGPKTRSGSTKTSGSEPAGDAVTGAEVKSTSQKGKRTARQLSEASSPTRVEKPDGASPRRKPKSRAPKTKPSG
jgi:Protein of unknown function (DUF2934)